MGADRTGEACQRCTQRERDELDAEAVDAHGGGGGLVFADGDPGAADAGVGGAVEDDDDDRGDEQHQQEVVREAAEGDSGDVVAASEVEPEDLEVRDHGDAVGAVGEVGSGGAVHVLDGDPEDLSEAEGDDGEVVAAQSQGGGADEDAEDERCGHAGEHGGPEGELDAGEAGELGAGDEGCGVGADAEEGDVSEVEESGEADDDVEAEGDGADYEDVDAEVGVVLVVRDPGEDRRGEERHGGGESLVAGVECGEAVEESGGEEGPGAEDDQEQVAEERFACVGVDADAVGEDDQGYGGGAGDDEAFAPGGELGGRGDVVRLGDVGLEGVAGLGECQGAEEGDQRADGGDVGAGVEGDEALEVDGDRDGAEPADGERGGGGEDDGLGGACRVEPAEAADVPEGE